MRFPYETALLGDERIVDKDLPSNANGPNGGRSLAAEDEGKPQAPVCRAAQQTPRYVFRHSPASSHMEILDNWRVI
jgi:hypothetical protein